MRTTRTHTFYFSQESLNSLINAAAELHDDLEDRKPYMTGRAYLDASIRLNILHATIKLLEERVT